MFRNGSTAIDFSRASAARTRGRFDPLAQARGSGTALLRAEEKQPRGRKRDHDDQRDELSRSSRPARRSRRDVFLPADPFRRELKSPRQDERDGKSRAASSAPRPS